MTWLDGFKAAIAGLADNPLRWFFGERIVEVSV